MKLGLIGALALLAGCSNGNVSAPIASTIIGRITGTAEAPEPEAVLPPAAALRGAAAERGIAAIRITTPDTGVMDALMAIALEEDRLTYLGRSNRTVVVRGSLMATTHSFGYDLTSVSTAPGDPIVVTTPLANWPASVTRTYQTPGLGPNGTQTTVTCTYQIEQDDVIDLFTPPIPVKRVAEHCSGDAEFVNRYSVEAGTGLIWDSVQWTGPEQGSMLIEVLEPFEP